MSEGQFANLQRNQQLEEAKAGRTQAAIPQAIQVGEAEAKTIRDNIAIAASQVQGLKELIGIGAIEQTQEKREIFAANQKPTSERPIFEPQQPEMGPLNVSRERCTCNLLKLFPVEVARGTLSMSICMQMKEQTKRRSPIRAWSGWRSGRRPHSWIRPRSAPGRRGHGRHPPPRGVGGPDSAGPNRRTPPPRHGHPTDPP